MLDTPSAAPRIVHLRERDNLVVTVDPIMPGSFVYGVTARNRIGKGHKMASAALAQVEPILKFGQAIGQAIGFMDVNCGDILDGVSIAERGWEIFETILNGASGERSKSELLGCGDAEFLPWQVGAVM